MSEIALRIEHISKTFKLPKNGATGIKQLIVNAFRSRRGYDLQKVLDDISFEVKKGEFFGIVGRNGSGKSTLLKLLSGIYTPDKGGIEVVGSLTPFIELGVGFNPELTGKENVYLNGALLGFSHTDVDRMYEDIVSFAELERFMNQKLKNYSSGMQVRLAFSIAIRANSDILILDEVLAVGDAAFQQKCFDYFNELQKSDKTIILVTHDMTAVQRFCDRALLLKDGKIVAIGKPLDIAEDYIAENVEAMNTNQKRHERVNKDLSVKIVSQTDTEVDLEFKFSGLDGKGGYIGFSLFKDGVDIAELNSSKHQEDIHNNTLRYSLSTESLNPGMYEITVAGFSKDRSLVATTESRERFVIKGYDLTRGAALKLHNSWSSPAES